MARNDNMRARTPESQEDPGSSENPTDRINSQPPESHGQYQEATLPAAKPGKADRIDSQPPESYEKYQEGMFPEAKQGIARFLITEKIIPRYKSVFLDAGSTVHAVAKELFLQEKEERQNLTILTNNMKIFATYNGGTEDGAPPVAHSLSLLLTGGFYDKDHEALFGDEAKRSLDSFFPYTVVMGTSGLRIDEGPFYHGHTPEGVIKRAIYEKPTHYRVIVCDCSKLQITDSFCAGKMTNILDKVTGKAYIVTSYMDQPEDSDAPEDKEKYKRYQEFKKQFAEFSENQSKDNTLGVELCLAVVGPDGKAREMYPNK